MLVGACAITATPTARVQVCFGKSHGIAVSRDGAVFTWGDGDQGQLGGLSLQSRTTPSPVKRLLPMMVRQVAAGQAHCMALAEDGRVYTWGRGVEGQLGTEPATPSGQAICRNTAASLGPQFVAALETSPVARIAAGARHSLAVTRNGELFAWGEGLTGQLGVGRVSGARRPARVSRLGTGREAGRLPAMADVAAGWGHSLALAQDGSLWAWGLNARGQLGVGDIASRFFPTQVLAPEGEEEGGGMHAVSIAAGAHHCAAINSSGQVFTWGATGGGRLGHGHLYEPAALALAQVDKARVAETGCDPSGAVLKPPSWAGVTGASAPPLRPFPASPGLAGTLYAFPASEEGGRGGEADDVSPRSTDMDVLPASALPRGPEAVTASGRVAARSSRTAPSQGVGLGSSAASSPPSPDGSFDAAMAGSDDWHGLESSTTVPPAGGTALGGGRHAPRGAHAQGVMVDMLAAMETGHHHPAAGVKAADVMPRTLPGRHISSRAGKAYGRVPQNVGLAAPPLLPTPAAPLSALSRFKAENRLRAELTSRAVVEGKEGSAACPARREPGSSLTRRHSTAAVLATGLDPSAASARVHTATALNHSIVSSIGVGTGPMAGGPGLPDTVSQGRSASSASAGAKAQSSHFRPGPLNNARDVAAVAAALADAGGAKNPLETNADAVIVRPTRLQHPALAHRLVTAVACGHQDTVLFTPSTLRQATPRSGATSGGTVLTLRGPGLAAIVAIATARHGISPANAAEKVPREEWYFLEEGGRYAVGKPPAPLQDHSGSPSSATSPGGMPDDDEAHVATWDDLGVDGDIEDAAGATGAAPSPRAVSTLIPIPDVMVRFTPIGSAGSAPEAEADAMAFSGALGGGRGQAAREVPADGSGDAPGVVYTPAFFAVPLVDGLRGAVLGSEASWGGDEGLAAAQPAMDAVPDPQQDAPPGVAALLASSVLEDTPLSSAAAVAAAAAAAAQDRAASSAAAAATVEGTESVRDIAVRSAPDFGESMRAALLGRAYDAYALSAPDVDEVLALAPPVPAATEMRVDIVVRRPAPVWAAELQAAIDAGEVDPESQEAGEVPPPSWVAVRGSAPFSYFATPQLASLQPSVVQVSLVGDGPVPPPRLFDVPQGPLVSVSGRGVFGAMLSDPLARAEAQALLRQVHAQNEAREAAEMADVEQAGAAAPLPFSPLVLDTTAFAHEGRPTQAHPSHAAEASSPREGPPPRGPPGEATGDPPPATSHIPVARFRVLYAGSTVAMTPTVPAWYTGHYSEQLAAETGVDLDEEGSDDETADRLQGHFSAKVWARVPPVKIPPEALPRPPPRRPLPPLVPAPSPEALAAARAVTASPPPSDALEDATGTLEVTAAGADEEAQMDPNEAAATLQAGAAWDTYHGAHEAWREAEIKTASGGGLELAAEVSPNGGFAFFTAAHTAIAAAPCLDRCEPGVVPLAPSFPESVVVYLRGAGFASSATAQVGLRPTAVWRATGGNGAAQEPVSVPDPIMVPASVLSGNTVSFSMSPSTLGALLSKAAQHAEQGEAGRAGDSEPLSISAVAEGRMALDVEVALSLAEGAPLTTGAQADGHVVTFAIACPKFGPPTPALLPALAPSSAGPFTTVCPPLGLWANVSHIVDAVAAWDATSLQVLATDVGGDASPTTLSTRVVPFAGAASLGAPLLNAIPGSLLITLPPLAALTSVPELVVPRVGTAGSASGGESPRGSSKKRSGRKDSLPETPPAPRVPRLLPLSAAVAGVPVEIIHELLAPPAASGEVEDATGLQEEAPTTDSDGKSADGTPGAGEGKAGEAVGVSDDAEEGEEQPASAAFLVAHLADAISVTGVGGGKKGKVPHGEAVTVTLGGWFSLLPLQLPLMPDVEAGQDLPEGTPVHPHYKLPVQEAPFPELPHNLTRLLEGMRWAIRLVPKEGATAHPDAGEGAAPTVLLLKGSVALPPPVMSEDGVPAEQTELLSTVTVSATVPIVSEEAGGDAAQHLEPLAPVGPVRPEVSMDGGVTWLQPPDGAHVTLVAPTGRRRK